jgi:WD40 repeat protein
VEAVAIAADGARALSSSLDQTIRMWDLQTGETLHALEGHSGFVRAVAATADGRQAISGSGDKTVRYWNVHAAPKLQSLKAHSEPVSLLAISSDGRTVISGSPGSALRVWDAGRDQVVGMLEGHQGLITNLWLDAAGKQAVTSARDGALRVWDLSAAALVRNLANPQGVRSARICADGTRAVCVSRDRTIRMWDLQSGRATRVLVSAEGGRAGPSLRTGSALLLELELAPVVDVCPKAITHDSGVAISPDGTRVLLALASSLCVWDVDTGGVLSEELEDTDMSAVAFDAQGSVAVLGSLLGTLRVWDLTHGKTLHLLQGHAEGIVDVVIPSDGRTAITADKSDALRMWDLQTGVERMTMTGKAGRVDAVSIAPNGEFAYSVYGDTVVASHVKRGAVLGSISVDHQITSVAVVPDGRRLALGDESGRVHFLRLEETLSTGGKLRGS